MLALALSGLDVRFPGLDRPALAIEALAISPGEQVAIGGPSGSGKTTLVNILTGLERAATGSIGWGDTDIASLSETGRDRWRARNVGLVMQEFHLFPGLSALDNVLLPQRLSHWRLPEGMSAEAGRLLARVGIISPHQDVATLSRGQMQRVAVARALVGRPGLIVADEPTASLDEDAGAVVADLLTELAAECGATLLVATHDRRLADRLPRHVRLENGRVLQS